MHMWLVHLQISMCSTPTWASDWDYPCIIQAECIETTALNTVQLRLASNLQASTVAARTWLVTTSGYHLASLRPCLQMAWKPGPTHRCGGQNGNLNMAVSNGTRVWAPNPSVVVFQIGLWSLMRLYILSIKPGKGFALSFGPCQFCLSKMSERTLVPPEMYGVPILNTGFWGGS